MAKRKDYVEKKIAENIVTVTRKDESGEWETTEINIGMVKVVDYKSQAKEEGWLVIDNKKEYKTYRVSLDMFIKAAIAEDTVNLTVEN